MLDGKSFVWKDGMPEWVPSSLRTRFGCARNFLGLNAAVFGVCRWTTLSDFASSFAPSLQTILAAKRLAKKLRKKARAHARASRPPTLDLGDEQTRGGGTEP